MKRGMQGYSVCIAAVLLLAATEVAAKDDSNPNAFERVENEYEQVLDAYFSHAYSTTPSAVVLRIYGGLAPEYEIVLDPINSPNAVARYTPANSIWGNVYGLNRRHLHLDEYIEQAERVPVVRVEFPVTHGTISMLLAMAKSCDMAISDRMPLEDHSGRAILVHDAPWYEVLQNQRTIRARVTSSHVVSTRNPRLVEFGQKLEVAYGPAATR
jgi:hypothetical protein